MKNIYLVGFMGTGKSVVGNDLAKRLNLDFLDMDELIEKKEGRKIKDIFAKEGEPYFRRVEKEVVKELSSKKALVVACGGGVVLDKDNIQTLKQSGSLICLTARPEVILERCQRYRHRPLLNVKNPKKEIERLLNYRAPFYAQAKFCIDTSDLNIEQAVDTIFQRLNLKGAV